jgi:signal transduction histidine kinase
MTARQAVRANGHAVAAPNGHGELNAILAEITAWAACDIGVLFGRSQQGNRKLSLIAATEPLADDMRLSLLASANAFVQDRVESPAVVISPLNECAALLISLDNDDGCAGVLALVRHQGQTIHEIDVAALTTPISAVRLLLENQYLRAVAAQNLETSKSLLAAAQALAEIPSPQTIVDMLRKTVLSPVVTNCTLLLFGPVGEVGTPVNHEYLEIQGAWSRRYGSGAGYGLRLYLHAYLDLLAQVDREKLLVIHDLTDSILARFDPLVRGFIHVERLRSAIILSLQSAQQELGVLIIASNKPNAFSPREIHGYQMMAEFLAISAMTGKMIEQHDRIYQGRTVLLDSVSDGVLFVLPGVSGGQVLTANQVFMTLFNLSDANLQGMSLEQLLERIELPEDIRRQLQTNWLGTPVRSPDTIRGEFRLTQLSGQPREIEWTSAPVYRKNATLGRIYTFHDVTADRTAERLRAEYLSRISHELRTPLTSIQGFADFILDANGDKLPPVVREYTQIISDSARHLKNIITDIINITRADVGNIQLSADYLSLPDIINDVADSLELQFRNRQQKLTLLMDDRLPPLYLDTTRMMQVLTNLLTNASKYSPEGSMIRLSTLLVTSMSDLPDTAPGDVTLPAALVTVLDEGKGIAPADMEHLFMPFFRSAEVQKQRIEGVGLGLVVSRSWIELHRGKIWAVSRPPASGGCFQFTLPVPRD